MNSARLLLALPLCLSTACGLITQKIDGTVRVDFDVDTEDREYRNDFVVDADENQDVRDNRDLVRSGQIKDVRFEILSLGEGNLAAEGSAELYLRRFAASTWAEEPRSAAIATVDAQPIAPGLVPLVLSEAQKEHIAELLFADEGETRVEIRFAGQADTSPVRFRGRATFELEVEAGL